MNNTIGVLGCGWLGLPLAKSFLENGNTVYGTTTSNEKIKILDKAGIVPFLVSMNEDGIEGPISNFLRDVHILILNVPPKLRGSNKENYIKKMQMLHSVVKASGVKKIIFVSSTSVYGEVNGLVTEETPSKPKTESGKQLLASEHIFANDNLLQTTVVRFGGLIGPNRDPIKFLSGRRAISNGNDPINLIHLGDCIGILKTIVENGYWNEIFNGVYPHHPPKSEYYTLEAQKRGLKLPEYVENSAQKGKIISSDKLINVKKYRYTTSIIG